MTTLQPLFLTGTHVTLVPLSMSHRIELANAVRDGEAWRLWYTRVPTPEAMGDEITRRLDLQARGETLAFAVLAPDGRPVGMTSFLNIDPTGPRVEIGATWYAASFRRTALNTDAKRLLLGHAFEQIGCIAVEFRTHFLNHASRRAIERLGAKLDGILRAHQRLPDGSLRDTCVYSITASEWPAIRTHLEWQLQKPH